MRTGDNGTKTPSGEDLAITPVGIAFRSMLRTFERDTGIGAPRWYMLSLLAGEDGLSQGEVCRRFDQDPSRITRLAQGLEADGLIRRERCAGDARVVRMHLTDEGRELVREFPERIVAFDRRVRRAMGDDELEELRRLLGALTDAMKD